MSFLLFFLYDRCLHDHANKKTTCSIGCIYADNCVTMKALSHGIRVIKDLSESHASPNNKDMIKFNQRMKDKHRDNMKHIHFRYCEEVSKLQEKPIIDRRSVLFNTPQILLANEKYTIVEVLDEYSQNWSIFKKNLSAF